MTTPDLLRKIRPAWKNRVMNNMAHGIGIRDDFQVQLDHFYDLLTQAVQSGDPAWLDGVLNEWSTASTQSDLREGQKNITVVLTRMIMIAFDIARDELSDKEALDVIGIILPIFTYALGKAAHLETESRVVFVSNELENTQKKLEHLDRTKSSFISVAAHELKTPLTLIEGYTAMIRDIPGYDQEESMQQIIDGVNTGIRRLRTIIDDMIDVSLIDSNLLSLNYQPLWFNNLFRLLEQDLSDSINNRKMNFEFHPFPGSDQMVFADPERIYQAFKNILMNAIKYTPDCGKIIVNGRMLPGFIEITIADTGIGISPQEQDVIFSKFGQLGNALLHSSGKTKFKGGGPGLGLTISRGIFEAHGGTIWVESEGHDENKCPGSIFHVLLPFLKQSPDPKLARLLGQFEEQDSLNNV